MFAEEENYKMYQFHKNWKTEKKICPDVNTIEDLSPIILLIGKQSVTDNLLPEN